MYLLFIWGRTYGFGWGKSITRAYPFKRPEKWISPHPNPYVQPHINNRYIGNFMDKRQETRETQEISGPIQVWLIIRGRGV